MALLPVDEALARILDDVVSLDSETAPLVEGLGRTLSADLLSRRTQPPWDTSAMDGYAVRFADVAEAPVTLRLIGAAPAGHGFPGTVGEGETVRIFTGAPLPAGADTIVIQENADLEGDRVLVRIGAPEARFVRRRGLDFAEGDALIPASTRLGPGLLGLAASMDIAEIPVRRRPVVAILATGDELVPPGGAPRPDQIIASNSYALAGLVTRWGGTPLDLGIATDDLDSISAAIARARDAGADVLVTLGGASVGEHDLVREALSREGLDLDFWKIAMRPGKPLMFGRMGGMRVLGLPGNPVSSIVCSHIFLRPLMERLLGRQGSALPLESAHLGCDLPENDEREDYLRATLHVAEDGRRRATPFPKQDSSMLATLTRADCLVQRPRHAPAATEGDACRILLLER